MVLNFLLEMTRFVKSNLKVFWKNREKFSTTIKSTKYGGIEGWVFVKFYYCIVFHNYLKKHISMWGYAWKAGGSEKKGND